MTAVIFSILFQSRLVYPKVFQYYWNPESDFGCACLASWLSKPTLIDCVFRFMCVGAGRRVRPRHADCPRQRRPPLLLAAGNATAAPPLQLSPSHPSAPHVYAATQSPLRRSQKNWQMAVGGGVPLLPQKLSQLFPPRVGLRDVSGGLPQMRTQLQQVVMLSVLLLNQLPCGLHPTSAPGRQGSGWGVLHFAPALWGAALTGAFQTLVVGCPAALSGHHCCWVPPWLWAQDENLY